jgi:stage II sporulation protein GA (sporulation sigma-E factor processing peptidase)
VVIYGDLLFGLNLVLDYALLLAAAKIAGRPFVRLRLLLGALVGAVYAELIFLPGCRFLSAVPCRLAFGLAMLLIAFAGQGGFWRLTAIFAAACAALGGGVLALTQLGEATLYQGVAATGADFWAVLLAGALGCLLLGLGFRRFGVHTPGRDLVWVQLRHMGRSTAFRALVDTGNGLTDRSNRRVIVAQWQLVSALLPPEWGLERGDFVQPTAGFEKLCGHLSPRQVALLSYRTVGLDQGLLLAIAPEEVYLNGARQTGVLVAASPYPVSDGGAYQGLVGP